MDSSHSALSDYYFIRSLGSGAFADVFQAIHKKTRTPVAIKVTSKSKLDKQFSIENVRREAEILSSLHHPFIAEFFEYKETETDVYLIMEFVAGCNLLEYVNAKEGLCEDEAREVFQQIVSALSYLHNRSVIHRDLKAENILIDKNRTVKIIDFGFSKANSGLFDTLCGSLAYCAPEILMRRPYSFSADVWSLGVVLYSIIKCDLPFFSENQNTHMRMILFSEPSDQGLPALAMDLIRKALAKNPDERITIQEMHDHPFLNDIHQKRLDIEVKQKLEAYERIDMNVVDSIVSKGWATKDLVASLRNGAVNEDTVTYRIMRTNSTLRAKETDRKKSIVFSLLSISPSCDTRLSLKQMQAPNNEREIKSSRENMAGLENQYSLTGKTLATHRDPIPRCPVAIARKKVSVRHRIRTFQ